MVDWHPTEAIARSTLEMAAALDDVESILVVDRDPGHGRNAFADVHVIPGWTPRLPLRRRFARILQEVRPDVVHVHGGTLAPVLGFAPVLRRLPVVVSCYRSADLPPRNAASTGRLDEAAMNVSVSRSAATSGGGIALARRALRNGCVNIVCTADGRVERLFADAGPVLRVEGAARVSERQASWSAEPVVVFAGRAQVGRGIDDLVAAFPTVLEAIPSARLMLALLPTPDAERWEKSLANVPWAEVRVGRIDDIDALLARCQVAAYPFRWSVTLTPSLAAAEALAVGLPLVATTVDCLAPLVEPGRNGVLVPPNDPHALARGLASVLRGPEAWQPLAEGARKVVEERWSWQRAAEVTRDAYRIAVVRHHKTRKVRS
jgi:glycosyltransferase involved in cell wall biosynthesis